MNFKITIFLYFSAYCEVILLHVVSLNLVRTIISLNLDEGVNGSWKEEFYSLIEPTTDHSLILTDLTAVYSNLFAVQGQVYSIDNFIQNKTQVSVYDKGKLELLISKPRAENDHVSFVIPYYIRNK